MKMFSDWDDTPYEQEDLSGCEALGHWKEGNEEEDTLGGTGMLKHWDED